MRTSFNSKILICLFAALLLSCSSKQKAATSGELNREVRLAEDRSKVEQLRKNVPEDVRLENDEKALLLNLFSDKTRAPAKIRERFNELVRRKRDEYSKNERRQRELYTRDEKKRREEFLAGLKKEREDANPSKMESKKRTEFFSEQDSARKRFFADEYDARRDFESKNRQERQDFEAHMKDMRSKFEDELKVYEHEFKSRRTMKNPTLKTVPPGFSEEDLRDLESIPKNAKPIEPGEGN